jgi:hypothetical protein
MDSASNVESRSGEDGNNTLCAKCRAVKLAIEARFGRIKSEKGMQGLLRARRFELYLL